MALTDEGIVPVEGVLSRWVRLPGGVKAHYLTAGDEGPVVVLLHGGIIGSSSTAGWRFMIPYLAAQGFRVYAPDQPSFGITEDPQGFYEPGPEGHVDFLHDFTTALCLDRFHLGGNSMGCNNTIQYVMAHPERVISYALIAGAIGDLVADEEYDAIRQELGWVVPPLNLFDGTATSMEKMMRAIIYRDEAIDPDLVEMRTRAANQHLEAAQRHSKIAFTRASDLPANLRVRRSTKGRLDRMDIPAIYLFGQQDVLRPLQDAYLQESRLPNVQFFFPAECGHQGQTDQPEMFNTVFAEFFGTGTVSRATADWAGVSRNRPELPGVVAE
ncbi:alpha/beta fold hydrolase [Aeromicrobium wangtongii]|uniref:alpha/beta fold hydrolase n=1 Tax=Aeromicrobium wangtongii TaxID=2969247 RepID=UPI0020171F5B|nr:alpha/beta hydrolase [Aeromicrobium wangtongii]MCL3819410.1 alpha/beta hydrolase [Aeromicrobium wangtongii]